MARHVWLLVEWEDENNVFPSYGVINVDTFSYKENDLQPGKQIFISLKNKDPRRAKVIRISDLKRQVKEHKVFLERQDQQVKNVLQLCMRTIKEMKSDQYSSSMETRLQLNITGQQSGLPHVITAKGENSASDSDTEVDPQVHQNKMSKYINKTHHQKIRYDPNNHHKGRTQSPDLNQRRRSIMSSTPVPGKSIKENIKLCFDQGTQTDNAWLQPPTAKIEEIELVLKHLYGRFQSLVMRVNSATVRNATMDISESEQNGEVSYIEPNNTIIAESAGTGYMVQDDSVMMSDVGAEQVIEAENESGDVKIPVKMEAISKASNESRVRRMSAQTTYSNEMVPIGNGHATVPARLLNEIDWTSHTTATRQLLQAIFPRKVLATHSLTGKQSPAHRNKPAKKLLNPNLIEDIIITVSTKSGVPQNLVRTTDRILINEVAIDVSLYTSSVIGNAITVKCTDEAKLYRNRQRYRVSRAEKNHQNGENIPPSLTHSSDDS